MIYSVGPAGNGSATINANNQVVEVNGASCIYVSNGVSAAAGNPSQDTQP